MAISIGHRLRKNDRVIVFKPDNHHAFTSGTLKGYVYEHIYNAECKLGRELLPGEVVHHIDENKVNNDPDNLLVFKSSYDHATFHGAKLRVDMLERLENGSYKVPDDLFKHKIENGKKRLVKFFVCDCCGRHFESTGNKARSGHIYCSNACTNKAKRRNVPVPAQQLLEEIKTLGTYKYVGDKYGVSAWVIKKRIKEAGFLSEASKFVRKH